MNYLYNVFGTSYENFEANINEAGKKGWDLIAIIPMQQLKGFNLDQTPKSYVFLKCVFKKPDPDAS